MIIGKFYSILDVRLSKPIYQYINKLANKLFSQYVLLSTQQFIDNFGY